MLHYPLWQKCPFQVSLPVECGKQLWVSVGMCAAQRAVLISNADRVCLGFFRSSVCQKSLSHNLSA